MPCVPRSLARRSSRIRGVGLRAGLQGHRGRVADRRQLPRGERSPACAGSRRGSAFWGRVQSRGARAARRVDQREGAGVLAVHLQDVSRSGVGDPVVPVDGVRVVGRAWRRDPAARLVRFDHVRVDARVVVVTRIACRGSSSSRRRSGCWPGRRPACSGGATTGPRRCACRRRSPRGGCPAVRLQSVAASVFDPSGSGRRRAGWCSRACPRTRPRRAGTRRCGRAPSPTARPLT